MMFFGVSNKNFQNSNLPYLNCYYYTGPTKSKWSSMLAKFILANPEYSNKCVPSIIHSLVIRVVSKKIKIKNKNHTGPIFSF